MWPQHVIAEFRICWALCSFGLRILPIPRHSLGEGGRIIVKLCPLFEIFAQLKVVLTNKEIICTFRNQSVIYWGPKFEIQRGVHTYRSSSNTILTLKSGITYKCKKRQSYPGGYKTKEFDGNLL